MAWTPSSRRSSRWKSILKQPAVVAQDLAARDLAVARHADLVRDLRLGQLLLGRADHRDLRDRRRCRSGKWDAMAPAVDAEGVTGGEPPLLRRRRGEARIADDVARGKDVRHGGAELGRRPSAGRGRRRRARPRARFSCVGRADRARPRRGPCRRRSACRTRGSRTPRRGGPSDTSNRSTASPKRNVTLRLRIWCDELVDDLAVEELERPVAPLDQRDLDAERGEHRRVLDRR